MTDDNMITTNTPETNTWLNGVMERHTPKYVKVEYDFKKTVQNLTDILIDEEKYDIFCEQIFKCID